MGLYHSDVCLVLSAKGLEDLTYRYGVSKSVARDILLAVSEELQYAMRRAGWEVINAAMVKK